MIDISSICYISYSLIDLQFYSGFFLLNYGYQDCCLWKSFAFVWQICILKLKSLFSIVKYGKVEFSNS